VTDGEDNASRDTLAAGRSVPHNKTAAQVYAIGLWAARPNKERRAAETCKSWLRRTEDNRLFYSEHGRRRPDQHKTVKTTDRKKEDECH